MTSGAFHSLPISQIVVDRPSRQRKELRNVDELAESISRLGLIHPPVVTRDLVLVAGERRLTACRLLGWTNIMVQFTDELDDYELQCIEFEENVKRLDLTWQEETEAVAKFHALKASNEPAWSAEKTAEALGTSLSSVRQKLQVAKELTNEKVAAAPKFSAALNVVQRNLERRKANTTGAVDKVVEAIVPAGDDKPEVREGPPLLCANFHEWQASYTGPRFNLIHCDFPYGINVADSPRQNAALDDHYVDTRDTYFDLLDRLELAMQNVVDETAHLIFWFSMDYYTPTIERLTAMGWKVNPFPLIWHKSDNSGIAPDPQRSPRRTYETALFASLGDRKLTQVGPRSNSFAHPGRRDDSVHISEKPEAMLRHFLSMVCDEYSRMLDPTCGSGNSVKVAKALGAERVLGLELSPDFHAVAVANWEKSDVTSTL